jgi:uncharacterized membrane protein
MYLEKKIKMGNFKSYALLAAVGSILMCTVYGSIIGILLVFIAMKGLAEHYKDDNIFQGLVMGVVFGIIGLFALALGGFGAITTAINSFSSSYYSTSFGSSILIAIASLVVAFIFMLLMSLNFRKALNALSDRSGEPLFRTAGTFMFFGAILTIVLVGIIALIASFVIMTVAFYALFKADTSTQSCSHTSSQTSQNVSTGNTGAKFCPYFGTSATPGTAFCVNCGKQI